MRNICLIVGIGSHGYNKNNNTHFDIYCAAIGWQLDSVVMASVFVWGNLRYLHLIYA